MYLACACSHNTEKVVYFLLLDRKLRNPSKDDEEDIKAKSECGKNTPFRLFTVRMLITVIEDSNSAMTD